MNPPFSRTCEINKKNQKQIISIEAMRDQHAYILLGDPGMGKTSAFQNEQTMLGRSGEFYSVKNFLVHYGRATAEQAQGKTFFIDGLDEVRAGKESAVIDRLRETLFNLGRPRFRLSCRSADWLGKTDIEDFSPLLPSGSTLLIAHLMPLNEGQIHQFLKNRGIEPQPFIQQAERHSLDAMLSNPQTLSMLSNSIHADGAWPQSRKDVFELACRKLATEHNERHPQYDIACSIDQLLDAASYGFAIMLLADKRAISVRGMESDDVISCIHTPGIAQLNLPLAAALKTRLFVGISEHSDSFDYLHRSIAEFLAARFLAKQIANGLPLGRILALICGNDGGIISGLRGVYAWLPVFLPPDLRKKIIARDPLAVVLYGDVKQFSAESKCDVISALHEQAKQFPSFRWHGYSFGQQASFAALATSDMAKHLQGYLDPLPPDADRQALAGCLLNAIEYGDAMPSLQSSLLAIVQNEKNWSGVRCDALDALLADENNTDAILCLLEQINSGEVQTEDGELLGHILTNFYPKKISPEKIFKYLKTEKDSHMIGVYHMFWRYTLPDNSRAEDFPVLLKIMSTEFKELRHYSDMFEKMVLKVLNLLGDILPAEQLSEWLMLENRNTGGQVNNDIQQWLNERPLKLKELTLQSFRKSEPDNPFHGFWLFRNMVQTPDWFYAWILESVDDPACADIKSSLFRMAKNRLELPNYQESYGLNELFACADRHPDLAPFVQNLYCNLEDEDYRYVRKCHSDSALIQGKKQSDLKNFKYTVEANIEALLAGTAPLPLINQLAQIYMCAFQQSTHHSPESPRKVLTERLGGDEELARIVIAGICTILLRTDLPNAQQVFESSLQDPDDRVITHCFMAARELSLYQKAVFITLPDTVLDLLIALHLVRYSSNDDSWYEVLVNERPDRIIKGYQDYLQLILSSGQPINSLYELAHDAAYAGIAKKIVPFALEHLPSIQRPETWSALRDLWQAGLAYCDAELLTAWLNQRLVKANRLEKSRLLTLGLYLDADSYLSPITEFAKSNCRKRLLGLAIIGLSGRREFVAMKPKSVVVLMGLITILGAVFDDVDYKGAVGSEKRFSRHIQDLIHQLATYSETEASTALEQLLANPMLMGWNEQIQSAVFNQKINSRNSNFSYPSIAAVVASISNLMPANAADLQALVLAHLLDLADNARNSSADSFKQFWNETSSGKADQPKVEESGRDVLLQWLRVRLGHLQLEISEEVQYADDKRVDIAVLDINLKVKLPIEIKRSQHPEVWTAVSGQLVPRYTRDPSAYGYGIYLVLWFGAEYMEKTHPVRRIRPKTAQQLQDMLEADLNDQEHLKIKICVFDVSKPTN